MASCLLPRSSPCIILSDDENFHRAGFACGVFQDLDGYFYVFRLHPGQVYCMSLSKRLQCEFISSAFEKNAISVVSVKDQLSILDTCNIYRYDPARKILMNEQAIPNPRRDLAAVAVGNKNVIIGGKEIIYWNSTTASNVEVFDVVSQTWSQSPPLPMP